MRFIYLILGALFWLPCTAGNLYYYLEQLPKSISERDYSRFKSSVDITTYVDSCKNELALLGTPSRNNIDHYTFLTTEIHDIIDQFPSTFKQINARDYTLMALDAIEKIHGLDSKRYSEIFADYLLYDCKDALTNRFATIIGQDAFSPDSSYGAHVRYKIKRYSDIYDGVTATIYSMENSLEKVSIHDELFKDFFWSNVLFQKSATTKMFDKMAQAQESVGRA